MTLPGDGPQAPGYRVVELNMRATTQIPNDRALPALVAILATGLAGVLPALEFDDRHTEVALRGYTPGSRATFEVRTARRHFAVKAYAEDPASEAELYEALAAAGLGGNSNVRVPPLLARDHNLRLLVIGWLEGPTARQLVERGQGQRAGELAAVWFQRAASLPLKFGPPFGAARMLHRAQKWAAALGATDPALGTAATTLVGKLALTQPRERTSGLVHGTFYSRHLLDLGDGPGVIDWQRFGQGPAELDAGMFLATIWRLGLRHEHLAAEASLAEEAFLGGTADLLDERALTWHRAAALLRLADKLNSRQEDWPAGAQHALLGEAARLAEIAG